MAAAAGAQVPASAAAPSARAATVPSAPASVPTVAQPPAPPVENSYLDGPLLKELLLAEFALREGQPGDAIELVLQAARQHKDDALFRRALHIAAEEGALDKALAITHVWHQTLPKSPEPVHTEVQLLLTLGRDDDAMEPLKQLLAMSPPAERPGLMMGLPRIAQRALDKTAAIERFRQVLQPYLDQPETRVAVRVALARMRLANGDIPAALELAAQAQDADPKAMLPVWLALDILNQSSGAMASAAAASSRAASAPDATATAARAEAMVRRYLDQPGAEPMVRQVYASVLVNQQRLTDAADQMRLAAQARPEHAPLWLLLGEIELELHHTDAAEDALKKALALVQDPDASEKAGGETFDALTGTDTLADTANTVNPVADADPLNAPVRVSHLDLLLARVAEQRHDDATEASWLAKVDAQDADLQVVALRASLLARHGKLAEARAMLQAAPANTAPEQRFKLLSEVQLLIDAKKLSEARDVLTEANRRTPGDVDLIYQEAMLDERLDKLDDMERLLRGILAIQPDNAQTLNALGYSFADRNLRLDEALALVKQAHDLAPADPFIVDSLGWVEYRLGHLGEATSLLNQAYASRQDTEIAAHLGEALWAGGRHEEAIQVLRDARRRDADNDVLNKTFARLKVKP